MSDSMRSIVLPYSGKAWLPELVAMCDIWMDLFAEASTFTLRYRVAK